MAPDCIRHIPGKGLWVGLNIQARSSGFESWSIHRFLVVRLEKSGNLKKAVILKPSSEIICSIVEQIQFGKIFDAKCFLKFW
jgi:hypothetical protein